MPYVHHIVIHFPVALGFLSALVALLAWTHPEDWADVSRRLSYLVALAALVAAGSGLLSAGHVIEEGLDASKVALHRNVALSAGGVLVLVAVLAWLGGYRDSDALARAARVGMMVAALFVGAAAHFGGDMLHPGMAPWSNEVHGHGAPSMDSEHVHDARRGQAVGESPPMDHSAMLGEGPGAPPSVPTTPPISTTTVPVEPSSSASTPTIPPPHTHSHGATERKAPASPAPGSQPADPTPTSPPPAATPPPRPAAPPAPMDMPPGHKM